MGWQEDLAEGEEYLKTGKWEEAYRIAERLSRAADVAPGGRLFRFMFAAAEKAGAIAHADALAKRLRMMPGDENKLAAASWFQTMAAEAFAAGRTADAIAQLQECLAIAPKHREALLTDPRLAGLIPAFDEHERESDSSVIPPPPPKPDPGPLPPLAKKTLKRARDLFASGKKEEAWDMLGRLRANDFHRKEALLLGFEVVRQIGAAKVALGLAELLQRGDREERKIVAKFYRDQALLAISMDQAESARMALKEAMKGMADFRSYFAEEPALARILETIAAAQAVPGSPDTPAKSTPKEPRRAELREFDDEAARMNNYERTITHLLAQIADLRASIDGSNAFLVATLEQMGLGTGEPGGLKAALQGYQKECLTQTLASVSDLNPALATELKRILDQHPG